MPSSGSYGVHNRAELDVRCSSVGLGLAGIEPASLIEVDEVIHRHIVDAGVVPS